MELCSLMVVLITAHFVLGDDCVLLVVEVGRVDLLGLLVLEALVVELVVVGLEHLLDVVAVRARVVDDAVSVAGNVAGGLGAALIVRLLLLLDALFLLNAHLLLVLLILLTASLRFVRELGVLVRNFYLLV